MKKDIISQKVEYKPIYIKVGWFKKFKIGYAQIRVWTTKGTTPYNMIEGYHLLKLIIFKSFKKFLKM